MTDQFTKTQRSRIMSRIRSKNTGPERRLKPLMAALGFSYQPKMYGRPDFASRKLKTVVFIKSKGKLLSTQKLVLIDDVITTDSTLLGLQTD